MSWWCRCTTPCWDPGAVLFDTYVPLVSFSIARDTVATRYAGLEVATDDSKDTRITEPHVVAVVSYASADKIVREALLTCDDPKRASLLVASPIRRKPYPMSRLFPTPLATRRFAASRTEIGHSPKLILRRPMPSKS